MRRKLDALVAEKVMGLPKPPPMTYRQAEAEDVKATGGRASCFDITRDGWRASVDWGAVETFMMRDAHVEWETVDEYSEDISAAWEVVEKLHDRSHKIEVTFDPDRGVSKTWKSKGKSYIGTPDINPNPSPHYVCLIMLKSEKYPQCWDGVFGGKGDTAPLAICVAALRVVGVPESEIEEAMR